MKYLKFTKYLFLVSLLALGACGKNEENNSVKPDDAQELKVDVTQVSIAQGDERTVNIVSGNGDYVVTSANEEVVTAEVDGNVVKLKALDYKNNANSVVYLKDKYDQQVKIYVETAATFDLKLSESLITLYSQVDGADEDTVRIYTGNGGYTVGFHQEDGAAAPTCVSINTDDLEETELFIVKGLSQGSAELEVKDQQGKTAYVTVNVIAPKPVLTDADEQGVLIKANQGSAQVKVTSGNGEYQICDPGDTKIIRLEIYGNVITVTGRRAGTTSFTVTDAKKQVSKPIQVTIAPDKRYAMNISRNYAVWTHFGEMTGDGLAAIKEQTNGFKLKQMTWEIVTRVDATNWLQTFIGKEGYFILRGGDWENNRGNQIELVGTGDKLKLRTGHGAFKLGEWMHIALVVDCSKAQSDYNNKYKLYINGKHIEWSDQRKTDINYTEIDLCAGNDGGRVTIGRASDSRRFLAGSILEARIWTVCRTEEQLKANALELKEEHPEGLLARWDFSAGAPVSYIEDGTNSDHELIMHICKYDSWGDVEFPMTGFEDVTDITVPFI